jgi:hypothetical protein
LVGDAGLKANRAACGDKLRCDLERVRWEDEVLEGELDRAIRLRLAKRWPSSKARSSPSLARGVTSSVPGEPMVVTIEVDGAL